MVKHPQGTLGYAVDGVIVFQPKRNVSQTTLPRHERPQETSVAVLRAEREALRLKQRKSRLQERLRFQPQMEDLKNSCKQGDLGRALQSAYNLSATVADPRMELRDKVSMMIRILFTSDIEGRSGIYYAAHTGQEELVQVFLTLLVLDKSSKRHATPKNTSPKSLLAWLDYVGFPGHIFSRADLELCVLNALNESTRQAIRHTKYTWANLCSIAKGLDKTLFFARRDISISSAFDHRGQTQKPNLASYNTRKKFPKVWEDPDELDDEDFWSDVEEELYDSPEPCDPVAHDSISQYNNQASEGFDHAEDHDPLVGWEDIDSIMPTDSESRDQTVNDIESQWSEFHAGTESSARVFENLPSLSLRETSSFHLVQVEDDLTSKDGLNSEFSFVQSKGESSYATPSWEVLADSHSVISLDSQQARRTYLEALRANQSPDVPTHGWYKHQTRTIPKLPKISEALDNEEVEEDDENMFDVCFELEGFKGARGGKSSRMFKGEGRTPWRYKYRKYY